MTGFEMKKFLVVALAVVFSVCAVVAEEIQFPEEELAKETVLPKFDRFEATKNRNVITSKKFEMGGYLGWNFTEAIFNQMKLGFNVDYHFSEDTGINVNFAKWMAGLNTQYTDSLYSTSSLDFTRAPGPEYSLYGHYMIKAYYGKMSLTKLTALNISVSPLLGGGITKYRNKVYPGFDGGVGIKFYFTPHLSLRTDFKLQVAQYPSPFLRGYMTTSQPTPTDAMFSDKWTIGTIFDLGLSYMF